MRERLADDSRLSLVKALKACDGNCFLATGTHACPHMRAPVWPPPGLPQRTDPRTDMHYARLLPASFREHLHICAAIRPVPASPSEQPAPALRPITPRTSPSITLLCRADSDARATHDAQLAYPPAFDEATSASDNDDSDDAGSVREDDSVGEVHDHETLSDDAASDSDSAAESFYVRRLAPGEICAPTLVSMFWAIARGDLRTMQNLLQRGLDISAADENGNTVLTKVVRERNAFALHVLRPYLAKLEWAQRNSLFQGALDLAMREEDHDMVGIIGTAGGELKAFHQDE
jgi:hypothetical protein